MGRIALQVDIIAGMATVRSAHAFAKTHTRMHAVEHTKGFAILVNLAKTKHTIVDAMRLPAAEYRLEYVRLATPHVQQDNMLPGVVVTTRGHAQIALSIADQEHI